MRWPSLSSVLTRLKYTGSKMIKSAIFEYDFACTIVKIPTLSFEKRKYVSMPEIVVAEIVSRKWRKF